MSTDNSLIKTLEEESKAYDFVRFTFGDLHGIAKSKAVPRKNVLKKIKEGVPFPAISLTFGPRTELIFDPQVWGPRLSMRRAGAMYCRPTTPPRVYPLPWAGGAYKVGEILCQPFWEDGAPQAASPRAVAEKQLQKLTDLGYHLFSAFESEFLVVSGEEETKPLFDGHDSHVNSVFVAFEPLVYEMIDNLQQSDIEVEYVHTECGQGQLELTGVPRYGLHAADMQFRLRNAVKEFCKTKGYRATFMSRPFPQAVNTTKNAMHLNHSLWRGTSPDIADRANVFYEQGAENGLSQVARHWLAGLCRHAPAITALCCPTVNCYRRMHRPFYPTRADWGYEDHMSCFRARSVSPAATFIESRTPSGASNPYLTLAATVAAGMDGLVNKMEPPPIGEENAPLLPKTLEEALKVLAADDVIVSAMGQEFMDWFVPVKRILEVEKFQGHDMKDEKDDEIAAERAEYFEVL